MSYCNDKSGLALIRSNQAELREEFAEIKESLYEISSVVDSINWLDIGDKIGKIESVMSDHTTNCFNNWEVLND